MQFCKGLKTKPMSICTFKIRCCDNVIRSVVVHSIHLKMRMPDTSDTRKFQLDVIEKINKKFDLVIMAGDYNFDDHHDDNNFVKYKYLDLQLHETDPKKA